MEFSNCSVNTARIARVIALEVDFLAADLEPEKQVKDISDIGIVFEYRLRSCASDVVVCALYLRENKNAGSKNREWDLKDRRWMVVSRGIREDISVFYHL